MLSLSQIWIPIIIFWSEVNNMKCNDTHQPNSSFLHQRIKLIVKLNFLVML